ncbi:hydroxyethylthiazole kinase [Archangium lipolyticum]|uniref:hydroxyethylthiazole kinase n=1 Tax=Archangium lipolyticum TaxID=2970465 RepID=UPI002149BA9C|nr:hydroxyethylthiazole kinase [Archangium lipolyticum]
MDLSAGVWESLRRVRERSPLVHNITNYVVMNNTANALLAVGASPAMVHAREEVADFAAISQALVVNIGTLSSHWVEGMHLAIQSARRSQVPWVLDPVGAGATRYRTTTAAELARQAPAVIRGNASEVLAVAGEAEATRGVDSTQSSEDSLEAARRLASSLGTVVAVTGRTDFITDGSRVVAVENGHPLMPRVTGMGCTASALVGAFLAVEPDAVLAAAQALTVLGIAGELAAEHSKGPGSLQLHLLDALYMLDEVTVRARARVR